MRPPVVKTSEIIMFISKTSNVRHPVGVLFLGLFFSQVIATIQVYLSNIALHASVAGITAEGYLAIPNHYVMNSLNYFGPAFFGGLFFSFSLGAGIALITMAAAWIWSRYFWRSRSGLIGVLVVWAGLLIFVNLQGFVLFPTIYLLMIPPIVFTATLKWLAPPEGKINRLYRIINLIPVPLLALLWLTQFDINMFLDLRDTLLLSNFVGKKFSNFYYTYTLYPAEAFKSLDQKIIRTCKLKNIQKQATRLTLEKILRNYDYLPMQGDKKVDLTITQKNNQFLFGNQDRQYFQLNVNDFFSDPQKALNKFSSESDGYAIFRQFTFLSLMFGFPILIYIVLHAVIYYTLFLLDERRKRAVIASVACLLIGFIVLIYFHSNRSANIALNDLAEDLNSEHWQRRVAALKIIQEKRLEISRYQAYPILLQSRLDQERYWLVRALAVSRQPHTYRDLLNFLDDPNPNVRTMAFYALGQRKNPQAVPSILEKIASSKNWYCQLYAYKALRSLGWKQTLSR